MKQITLNSQEVETLVMILEMERINPDTSGAYNTIVNNIITKLNEE